MAKQTKKANDLFRRPLVRIVLIVILAILLFTVLPKLFKGKKVEEKKLVGHQRLIEQTQDGEFSFLDPDGNYKKYTGYLSMSDFYYDTTNVSKENKDGNIQYALINKNKKEVVKYGTYENILQVIGGKYYKVVKGGKFGVIDYKGKVLIDAKYDSVVYRSVGEDSLFECKKDGKSDFINEKGKTFATVENDQFTISSLERLNDSFDYIVKITVDNNSKYYNLTTGDELFSAEEKLDLSYNILKGDSKITLLSKNYKDKKEIDSVNDYSVEARAYFNKYILVEQKSSTTGKREYRYTVYNDDLKVVLESDNRISMISSSDGDIYFLVNEEDGVKIVNEDKKSKKIKGYEFNSNSIADAQGIILNPIGENAKNVLFDFKGKKLDENVIDYYYKGNSLTITKNDTEKYLEFTNGKKYNLTNDDGISSCGKYLIVEDIHNGNLSIIKNDGKVAVDRVQGAKIFYNDNYVGVQLEKTVNIYNVNTGKISFTYTLDNYVDRNESVNYVELRDGFYTFDGKKVIEKVQNEGDVVKTSSFFRDLHNLTR